jgi:Raf kinase inhibitor-like YbhB/YbcL family protein
MMVSRIIVGLVAIVLLVSAHGQSSSATGGKKMKITSSGFQQGANIPSKFSCDGANTSPPLQIQEIPPAAKSLVLIVDDPDAPSGLFTHWIAWNISPQTSTVPEGSLPKGMHGTNDFGKSDYSGPCPPSGTHRYFFKIFALDQELNLAAGAKRAQLDAAMKGHVIAQGELMGRYSRSR